ncbi:unnamed protein product [Mycena citricolor]|uniref:Uncharacterized protein n=1 Tax=Mycena citricolor TaxID=2018698 RepID=A0AAD2JWD5_9AGAR|nr:unnamed protein product [Mycena citricolor]
MADRCVGFLGGSVFAFIMALAFWRRAADDTLAAFRGLRAIAGVEPTRPMKMLSILMHPIHDRIPYGHS